MDLSLSKYKNVLPFYLWYEKYKNPLNDSWLFATKFFLTEILPFLIMGLMHSQEVLRVLIFFYIYEIGYWFNNNSYKNINISISVRIILSLSLLFLLTRNDILFLVLVLLGFLMHNVFAENSKSRIYSWLYLNVSKVLFCGGLFGLFSYIGYIAYRFSRYANSKRNIKVSKYIVSSSFLFGGALLIYSNEWSFLSLWFALFSYRLFRNNTALYIPRK